MNKEICAILCVDDETNHRLEQVRKVLDEWDLPHGPLHGHITLAHYPTISEADIAHYTEAFLRSRASFHVNYYTLHLLTTNCIAALPKAEGALLEYYRDYHQQFDALCDKWTSAEEGLWLPHSSLYYSDSAPLLQIKADMDRFFKPFMGHINRFQLSCITDSGYDIIYTHDLL